MDKVKGRTVKGNNSETIVTGTERIESNTENENQKTKFSCQCSFLISLLGYSIGTSDFWRFPYLVYRNGGGAVLIPFAITMLVCGLPLLFYEVTLSQFSGKGPLAMWDMSPFFRGIGFTFLIINLLNNVYYNILRAWILEYFVRSFSSELPWIGCHHHWNKPGCIASGYRNHSISYSGHFNMSANTSSVNATEADINKMTDAEQFWQFEVLHLSPGIDQLGGLLWNLVLYVLLWRVLVTLCMIKSIKSIEKVMFITVFTPILLMMILWIRSMTLEGSAAGMLYYITPSFSRLSDVNVWIEAAMMASYTLGPGWGTIPMIGSHNQFSWNTVRYSILSTFCDFLSAVLNGLICFSILGVMAHNSGISLDKIVSSGLSIGFTVYPTAFTYFPLSQLWAAIFFINLIVVGLDAQVLSAETVMNCFEDKFPKFVTGNRRFCVVVLINVMGFILTLPFCTRAGCYIFQLLDWYAVAWTLLFVCGIECIVFSWVYGNDRISCDLMMMTGWPLPTLLRIFGSLLTPIVMLILLTLSFMRYKPPIYGKYTYPLYAEVLGWCFALLVISPIIVYFIWKYVTCCGTWKERICKLTKPNNNWRPNKSMEMYDAKTDGLRSFKAVLIYNITGRQRTATKRYAADHPEPYEISPFVTSHENGL